MWYANCHDSPEKYLPPKDQIYNMESRPPADQAQRGAQLEKTYHISRVRLAQLEDCSMCPPMNPIPRKNAANEPPGPKLDLASIRAKLDGARRQEYWRSLEEIAETKKFQEMLHREFPPGASEWWDGLSRRNFLKMAAATMALSGLTACTKQPTREIYSYVKQPEQLVLGQPLYYATTMVLGGFGTGVLARRREGHPIKVDGNPEHPSSLGLMHVRYNTPLTRVFVAAGFIWVAVMVDLTLSDYLTRGAVAGKLGKSWEHGAGRP